MNFGGIIKGIVKETLLIPVNVIRGAEEAMNEMVDPKEEKNERKN